MKNYQELVFFFKKIRLLRYISCRPFSTQFTFKPRHKRPERPDPGLVEHGLALDERLADEAVADPQELGVTADLYKKAKARFLLIRS